jgi:hypothetical protein
MWGKRDTMEKFKIGVADVVVEKIERRRETVENEKRKRVEVEQKIAQLQVEVDTKNAIGEEICPFTEDWRKCVKMKCPKWKKAFVNTYYLMVDGGLCER